MILTTLLATLALAAPQGQVAPVPLVDHKQLRIATTRLATEYPNLLTVLPIGESREGRPIEALRLAAGELTPGRPAILLVAGLDGPWAWTSGLALHHVRSLAEGYTGRDAGGSSESKAAIRGLLDTTTLYVVLRANPDAAEARFQKPLLARFATGYDVDNDRDGQRGEDGPEDVNGDGLITWMRVPDPEGEWIADPTDGRAHKRADRAKGERGKWKILPEGRDRDRDELVAEDPARDAIVNRNFPHRWTEHDAAAGLFPTDEPETRALADYVLAHPDIALVVTYGALDNLVDPAKPIADDAPSVKRIPPSGTRQSDADALAELAQRYKELTGSKAVTPKATDRDRGEIARDGSFQSWCHHDRGLWTLDLALWSVPLDTPEPKSETEAAGDEASTDEETTDAVEDEGEPKPKPAKDEKPSDDVKRLRWFDTLAEAEPRFLPWTAVQHPDLGPVEIGGFAPYATIEPPAEVLTELAAKELEFLISLGGALPRVRVIDCTYKRVHDDLYEVEAAIESTGLLPVHSRAASLTQTPRPIRVAIELPRGARVLAGRAERLLSELPGAARREELTWLVGGATDETFDPGAIRIVADTDHAGVVRAAPEERR